MERTQPLALLLALLHLPALAATASAQQVPSPTKQAASLPHMEDVKTSPIVDSKETGPAVRSVTDADLQPASARARALGTVAGRTSRAPRYPLFDVGDDGTQWVSGATYKASFGESGATYVPFLGSRAPRSWPVTMHIESVTCGGAPIGFEAQAQATRDGATISFDRGSFTEEYLIERDGMEQRFVFDMLPSRGEIVVTIDIETQLAGRADAAGLVFETDRGHARYGSATALDRRGHTIAMEERLENGNIQLVVPAEFVATAELPLVVDPFVSTFNVDTDNDPDSNADVAFVVGAPAALVVYEVGFGGSDHDVYAEKYVDEVFQGSVILDNSTADWRNPRVAGNELNDRFLCVSEVGAAPTRIIRGRYVDASTLTPGAKFTISGTETGDKHDPDVGGDPLLLAPTYFYVVWQRDFSATDTDIHSRLIAADGSPITTSVTFLANSSGTLDSLPSISKTDGNGPAISQNWSVVWQHEFSASDDDVQGARVRWDGFVTSPTFSVAASVLNERFPTASEPLNDVGGPRYWLAAYTLDSDLRFRSFNGATTVDSIDLAAGTLQSNTTPDVTTDGRLWQVAYTQTTGILPPNYDVRATSLSMAGGALSFAESSLPIAGSSTVDERRPRIAGTLASTTDPYRAYIAYDRLSSFTGLDVLVGVYDSPVNAGGYAYCFGTASTCPCGNAGAVDAGCASSVNPAGATLVQSGTWAVTSDTAEITASGMPATASALFFQGSGSILGGTSFGDGIRCASGSTVRLATKTSVGGSAHYPAGGDTPLSVRGGVPASGGWRYYQVWYRNAAVFCTSANFNLTSAVALLWLP